MAPFCTFPIVLVRRWLTVTAVMAIALIPRGTSAATLQPHTVKAWDADVAATEARIPAEVASARGFLVSDFSAESADVRGRILRGETVVSEMASSTRGRPGLSVAAGIGSPR